MVSCKMSRYWIPGSSFVKSLPKLPISLTSRLKRNVYDYLEIKNIDLTQINLLDINQDNLEQAINLEKLEEETGFGYRNVVAPPVMNCVLCNKSLHHHNNPTNIVIHGFSGPRIRSKYTLRCKRCESIGGNSVMLLVGCFLMKIQSLSKQPPMLILDVGKLSPMCPPHIPYTDHWTGWWGVVPLCPVSPPHIT